MFVWNPHGVVPFYVTSSYSLNFQFSILIFVFNDGSSLNKYTKWTRLLQSSRTVIQDVSLRYKNRKINFYVDKCTILIFVLSHINPLNTKRRLLYLKTQFVPRSKQFSSRL